MKRSSHLTTILVTLVLLGPGCGDNIQPDPVTPPDAGPPPVEPSVLLGRAVLPAATFAAGPASGTRIGPGPIHGQEVPFDSQPVQGFSAVLANSNGTYLAMTDNGFGALENSADFHLRVYTLWPHFATAQGGAGVIEAIRHFELSDPDHHIPFAITNHFTTERILTGADFDIESMQRAPDGTLWFGDEFGPFLLHTSAEGVVLEPPIELPDLDNPGRFIRSPQNPYQEEASAVRIMNAVRRHAELHESTKTPVFSPYHVMLDHDGADPSAHYARGDNPQPGLTEANSNVFNIESIQAAGYPIVTWTVNDKARMLELLNLGVDGIISDRPDLLLEALQEFDPDGDDSPDYLTAEGLIDTSKFDAQGHRGGRDLRPENTLPAMEVALDNLMVTLETDTGITQDGVPMLSHDPYVQVARCRHQDGTPYEAPELIKDLTAAEIQSRFICDGIIRGEPQSNDPALSPVAAQFAADNGLASPYVMPTLEQLFDFVDAYVDYYQNGAGSSHADAERRWRNAMNVRFNIETKLNPRSDTDGEGNVYSERTIGPGPFAEAVADIITARGREDRADIQSFDFRTLLHVQETYPDIRTVYLFGDFPIYDSADSSDGTNLQDESGANTPWLAGLYWPYRATARQMPFRLARSGGFEGMALSADGTTLLPLLEKPLDSTGSELLIHSFDLDSGTFTDTRYIYPLETAAHYIGDFIMIDDTHGLVIERDNSQGTLDGFKAIYRVALPAEAGQAVDKRLLVDLLNINDSDGIATGAGGDLGVGGASFAFPFVTIESIFLLAPNRVGVMNDNNFPFSVGRHVGTEAPDDSELIVVELPRAVTGAR